MQRPKMPGDMRTEGGDQLEDTDDQQIDAEEHADDPQRLLRPGKDHDTQCDGSQAHGEKGLPAHVGQATQAFGAGGVRCFGAARRAGT